MNIINKLTLRHLKENKGRTVITTLGICVSVAMITAVFVALASFLNLFGELEMISSGSNQASINDVTQSQLAELRADDRISEIGIFDSSEKSFQLCDRKNDMLGTGDMSIGDEVYIKQMLTVKYDGVLPKNENEIAIEQKLLDRNNLKLKAGDKIRIREGKRYIADSMGEYPIYNSDYQKGEAFIKDSEREYTITAILHNNPATRFTPVIRGMSALEKTGNVGVTIALSQINYKSLDVLKEIIKTHKLEGYKINTEYLSMYFAFDEGNEIMASLLAISAIILAIIMIASVVLIYNAFSMSISERVRYLGMLASVGATRKQKRLSVYFESFVLAAVGIPLGLVGGIVGIGVTLKAIGGKIISSGMITGIGEGDMNMKIVVPVWAIIGIILVSLFTVFISSYIPSRKASRVTPIAALRQANEIKVKSKRLRSSRLVKAIFGYEGELANKNLKRNGSKARVITASIALSVVLFLSCNYFCGLFTQSLANEGNFPYQLTAMVKLDEKDKLLEKLEKMNDVDRYYCVNNTFVTVDSENAKGFEMANAENLTLTYKRLFDNRAVVYKNVLDDEMFNELCRANAIDYNAYYGSEYKALLLNNVSRKSGGAEVFTDSVKGSSLSGLFGAECDGETIGDLVEFDEGLVQCRLNPSNTISIYEPLSQYIKFHESSINAQAELGARRDTSYIVGIETTKHSEVTEEINEFSNTQTLSECYVNDIADSFQTMNTISFVIQVLVYGFIVLISLITVFNIINTISTGVSMRKKEFAMLKSVGTTPKGFNKMIMLESAFYGIKALVLALPVSAVLSFAMYRALDPSGTIAFEPNYALYIGVTAVVFLITGMSMIYSVNKTRKENIIETLKQDIS